MPDTSKNTMLAKFAMFLTKIISTLAGKVNTDDPRLTNSRPANGGNSATSTALQTARRINGALFNGTSDITTVFWGATRTIKMGTASKAYNGSEDLEFALNEMGAFPSTGGVLKGGMRITNTGDSTSPNTGSLITEGGIGAAKTIWAGLDVVAYSDARLKTDLKPIEHALDKVNCIRGLTFTRTDAANKGVRQAGVLAQDVQAVLPEAVFDAGGNLGVSHGQLTGLLIEAIKELSVEVETLRTELRTLSK